MTPVDFKSRFMWLLRTFLVVVFIIVAAYGVLMVGESVMAKAKVVRCENNLKQIGVGLLLYKQHNKECLPPYIALLYPDYVNEEEVFICPADRHRGMQGAFPAWIRSGKGRSQQSDWREEFGYADLDGPTLDHRKDKDTFPCSYYYRFNDYPVDKDNLDEFFTWRRQMEEMVRKYGNATPVVSCMWHLPEYAADTEGVTTNLLFNLSQTTRYPKHWLRAGQ